MDSDIALKFERVEKKFPMNENQYNALLPLLEEHMRRDKYGLSEICNIYYDTPDYMLIRRSIERPPFKEKLRIRSYKAPENGDKVFVELKRKHNGIGYKRRICVTFEQAKTLLSGQAINCDNPQTEGELLEFVERYHPIPLVYLTYQRFAMFGKNEPELRITIDTNLQYKTDNADNPQNEGLKPIMNSEDFVLMEIKTQNAIPLWLANEMSRLKIYQMPFSKIGTCYTEHILKG